LALPISLSPLLATASRKQRWLLVLLGLGLLILSHWVALLYRIQPAVSLWFPPAGVAIALTFWMGPVGIVLTGIASVCMAPLWGSTGWSSLVGWVDSLEPLVAWLLYCHVFRGSVFLKDLRDAIAFLISAPLVASATSAIVGSFALVTLGKISSATFNDCISHWWLGNAIGTLSITPTLLLTLPPLLRKWRLFPDQSASDVLHDARPCAFLHQAEFLLLLGVSAYTTWLTVAQSGSSSFALQQLSLISFIPIIWAATRFGCIGGMLVATFTVIITLLHYLVLYPNALELSRFPVDPELLHVHKLSLLVQCAIALLVGTAITERTTSQIKLAIEQVRLAEYEAHAQLSEKLFQVNRLLTEAVTNSEHTEAALRSSNERFQLAAAAVNCLIYDWDIQQDYIERTEGLVKILGYLPTEAEPSNRWWREQIHPDDCALLDRDAKVAQIVDHRYSLEYRVRHKQGQYIYVLDQGLIIRDEQGQPIRVVGSTTDISDRKLAEEALRRSEARARRLIDSNLIGVLFANPVGTLLDANDAFLKMIGYSREELVHLNWRDLTPVEYAEQDQKAIAEIRATGVCTPFEKEYIRKDGTRISVLLGVTRVIDTEEECACFALDLTESKRIEAERAELLIREQAARQQAETASRMKDEFLAIVSHELRSPLNAILGWARLLRTRKFDPATIERALEVIERNAQAQTQLIEDLLDISRIIRGTIRLYLQPLHLAQVVQAALDTVRPMANNKQIHLETHLDSSLMVSGDFDRLQQIVWNLLSNAVKFTPEDGQVTIWLEQTQPSEKIALSNAPALRDWVAQIRVVDTGKGIHPDFLPHVFDRFRQADGTSSRTQGGLGLGLAIVRNLAELHGGTVFAESEGEGRGATFIVQLPLWLEDSEQFENNSNPATPLPTESLAGLKILVVDDNPDTLEFMTTALSQYDVKVITANSAHEALQRLQEARPDILLSDIGMPGEDGYVLIRQVRSLPQEKGGQIPAAALTAYVREEDRMQALAAGFQMHIPKPIDPVHLLQVVTKLAEGLT